MRYGNAYDALIAGEFTGKLKNGGEKIQLDLVGSPPTTLHSIHYDDKQPWPKAADGFGSSLLLLDPAGFPDHSLPSSWTASAHPGGHPGGDPVPLSYQEWRLLAFSNVQSSSD